MLHVYDERGILSGQQRHAVEFIAWLCNNNAACEVLRFSDDAVYSCFEICESIWWFSRFSMHCNVSNSHQALTEVS